MTNGLFGGCFGHFNMYHHLKDEEDEEDLFIKAKDGRGNVRVAI